MEFFSRLFGNKPALTAELRERIRRSFNDAAADEEHFPSSIDPRIYHVQLILEFFGPLGNGRALDAGCGKGRFSRVLHQRNPEARFACMDIAEAMLQFVPQPLRPCAGSLTALPFQSESFDFAYATESLEHAVEIETAVAEVCRVVKPGGKIVVIDKNREHWGKLETPDWERWFTPKELSRLLSRHCREVEARPISYWEDVEPDGMFYAWLARK
jgi:ubiquinone/menaquinone biosynthesis C-methylase UbiE